jgi:hypothetical protein
VLFVMFWLSSRGTWTRTHFFSWSGSANSKTIYFNIDPSLRKSI